MSNIFKGLYSSLILVGCAVMLSGCGGGGGAPSSSQILSISASPAQSAPNFNAALNLVRSAGVRGQYIDLSWKQLEPSPGVYDFSVAGDQFNIINSVGRFQILVGIDTLNTTIRDIPADLASVPFDAPQMKTRFQNMLQAFLANFGSQITYMAIGNEPDVYLGSHPSEWGPYTSFYQEAAALVRRLNPSIKVGVTTTFDGATTQPQVATLNATSDVFMMNYYPLRPDFTPRDPSEIAADFTKFIAASQGKPIVLQEVGFPTAASLGSSEALQAQFVTNVFSAWAQAGARIPFLNFFLLHDVPPAVCAEVARIFGLGNPNFAAFFCSLGLRNSDGTPKQAWQAFVNAAQAGGFTAQPK